MCTTEEVDICGFEFYSMDRFRDDVGSPLVLLILLDGQRRLSGSRKISVHYYTEFFMLPRMNGRFHYLESAASYGVFALRSQFLLSITNAGFRYAVKAEEGGKI